MRYTILVLAAAAFVATHAEAQVSKESLNELRSKCERKIVIDEATFSDGGKIRAEYITYCEARNGEQYLFFEAAAMHMDSFRGRSQAPWMRVTLQDKNGKAIWESVSDILVEVPNCGGYQFYVRRLPAAEARGKVAAIKVSMGGTDGASCREKNIVRDAIATAAKAIRAAKDCASAGLSPDELEICNFMKAAGTAAAGGQ